MKAKQQFRRTGYDIAPLPPKPSTEKPGTLPPSRIPIFDHKGRMRGHVGHKATAATVARFTGSHGAKIGKRDGRTAWISDGNVRGGNGSAAKAQNNKITQSLRLDRGSNARPSR